MDAADDNVGDIRQLAQSEHGLNITACHDGDLHTRRRQSRESINCTGQWAGLLWVGDDRRQRTIEIQCDNHVGQLRGKIGERVDH